MLKSIITSPIFICTSKIFDFDQSDLNYKIRILPVKTYNFITWSTDPYENLS